MKVIMACFFIIFSLQAMNPTNQHSGLSDGRYYFCENCPVSNTFYSEEEFKIHFRHNHLKTTTAVWCLYNNCQSLLPLAPEAVESHVQTHLEAQRNLLFNAQELQLDAANNAFTVDNFTPSATPLNEELTTFLTSPNSILLSDDSNHFGQPSPAPSRPTNENDQQRIRYLNAMQTWQQVLDQQQQLQNINNSTVDSHQNLNSASKDLPQDVIAPCLGLRALWHQQPSDLTTATPISNQWSSYNSPRPEARQYPCIYCEKVFRAKDDYQEHMRTAHKNEYCWVCESGITEANLDLHFQNNHPSARHR